MILGNASIESSEVSVHSAFNGTYLSSENLTPGHRLPSWRYMGYTYLFNMGHGKVPVLGVPGQAHQKILPGRDDAEVGDGFLSDDHYIPGEFPLGQLGRVYPCLRFSGVKTGARRHASWGKHRSTHTEAGSWLVRIILSAVHCHPKFSDTRAALRENMLRSEIRQAVLHLGFWVWQLLISQRER